MRDVRTGYVCLGAGGGPLGRAAALPGDGFHLPRPLPAVALLGGLDELAALQARADRRVKLRLIVHIGERRRREALAALILKGVAAPECVAHLWGCRHHHYRIISSSSYLEPFI